MCYVRWLSTVEASISCAHIIKQVAIILRNGHKTWLLDLPLSPPIGTKQLRPRKFLMIIAPSCKNRRNASFPMFSRIPPASDQRWGDHHRTRVFLCNSIVTGFHWIYHYWSVNTSGPDLRPWYSQHLGLVHRLQNSHHISRLDLRL